MKRPILIILLSLVHGELTATGMYEVGQTIVFLALVIIILACGIVKKKYFFAFLYVIFFAVGFINMHKVLLVHEKMENISEGSELSIIGEVSEAWNGTYGSELIIKVKGYNYKVVFDEYISEDVNGKAIGQIYELIGNRVRITGKKKNFGIPANQGSFDERKYNYSNNIIIKIKGERIEVTDGRVNEFKVFSAKLKIKLNSVLKNIAPEKEAGVFMAMLYGEKEYLDEELKGKYEDGGISHILAISGLHISIAGMGVYKIIRKYMSSKCAGIISTSFMMVYAMLAGGSVSASRAIIMFFINLLSKLTGYEYDIKNAMCMAGLILLWQNPYYIYNVGFMLSFGAIVAVGFMAPYIVEYLQTENKIVNSLIISICVNLINAPIVANAYYEISFYGMFINLFVIPLMSIAVTSGFIGLIVGSIWTWGGRIIITLGVLVLKLYEWICGMIQKLPLCKIVTGHFEFYDMVFFYGLILLLTVTVFCITKKSTKFVNGMKTVHYISALIAAVILHFIVYTTDMEKNVMTFLDVGQGESAVLVSGEGRVFLFDAGSSSNKEVGEYTVLPYLKYTGISEIDYAVLSHSDEDHINGMRAILEDNAVKINNIIIPCGDDGFEALKQIAGERNVNIIMADDKTKISGKDINIRFLSPMRECGETIDDVNENSLVSMIEMNGRKIVMTGDIGEKTEKILSDSGKLENADVLKVAHHGSGYSSSREFLEAVRPEISIISCGENNSYGHPHKEAIERISAVGSKILYTMESGQITLLIGEDKLDILMCLNYDL